MGPRTHVVVWHDALCSSIMVTAVVCTVCHWALVCEQYAHWAPAVCTVLMLCATYGDNSSAPEPSLMSFLFHSD